MDFTNSNTDVPEVKINMAVPKRKMSKARRDQRRANWKLEAPG